MCSGVLPQHPPAMLTRPSARELGQDTEPCRRGPDRSRSAKAGWAAPRSDSTKSRRPLSASSSRNGYIRSGPSEQFRPIENGLDVLHRVPERLDRLRRDHRLAAASHRCRDHDRQLLAARRQAVLIEDFANRHQRGLRVQRIENRLHQQQVCAARDRAPAPACLYAAFTWSKVTTRKPAIVCVGRVGQRHGERTDRACHETRCRPCRSDSFRPLAALARGLAR